MKINLKPNFIKKNLKNTSGKDVGVILNSNIEKNNSHNCFLSYNCPYTEILDLNSNSNYNCLNTVIEDHQIPDFLKGGAPAINKKKSNKGSDKKYEKDANQMFMTEYPSHTKGKNILEIKTIGNEVLELITKKYPYIPYSVNFSDPKISSVIQQIIRDRGYNLTNYEYSLIIQYLSENLLRVYKNNLNRNHSLLALIDDKTMLTFPTLNKKDGDSCKDRTWSHSSFVEFTKIISKEWTNLSSLFTLKKAVKMEKNLMHPLFFLLASNKIPGFEDLAIQQDYRTMIEQLKLNELDKDNMSLLLLRITDTKLLPTTDIRHQTPENNEMLRMIIAQLTRWVITETRRGTFESTNSCLLFETLDKIKMTDVKFEEERLLHALLAVFSFKPSLIAETKKPFSPNTMGEKICLNTGIPLVPKAVYSIEYPIKDFYDFSKNEIPVFSDSNFAFMGFDPKTQKVLFTYSDTNTTPSTSEDILLQIYKMINTKSVETDYSNVVSSILTHSNQIEDFYKDMKAVKIFLTNGVSIVTIPRYQHTYYCGPGKNIFFKTNIKPTLNLAPVAFEQMLNINKNNYFLKGALCYDTFDNDSFIDITNFNFVVDAKYKSGIFAIVKAGDDWLEYNPQYNLTTNRSKKYLQHATDANMLFDFKESITTTEYFDVIPQELRDQSISQLLSSRPESVFNTNSMQKWLDKNYNEIKKHFNNNQLSHVDMIISERDALEKISTRACIMIYAEDYDSYQSRINEKIL